MIGDELNKRDEEKEQKKEENKHNAQNNAKVVRAAANVAEKSGEPHAAAIGAAVNTADKLTGGKSSELIGHGMNVGMKLSPGGKFAQNAINKAGDSGTLDKANKALSLSNGKPSGNVNNNKVNNNSSLKKDINQKKENLEKTQKNNDVNNQNNVIEEKKKKEVKIKKEEEEQNKKKTSGCLIVVIILLITLIIVFLPLLLIIVPIAGVLSSLGGLLSFNSYYESKCSDVTVIFVDPDNNYEVIDSKSYTMNDYVAGVVAAEVGSFSNKEVYKTFAVAARTYAEMNLSDECSIEASERMQAFTDITSKSNDNYKLIYEAVEETEGEVVVEDGSLYLTEYDAFCYTSKDTENYILSQQDQKIPVSWVDSNISNYYYKNCPCEANDQSLTQCFSNGSWIDGGHGRGMSQYGALYLATEMDYTYDQILAYYYGDDIVIASNSFISSIAGLEIKDTTNATALNEQITSFLSSKGSSLDDLNNYVHDSVSSIGAGTREGVVTAAVSMINYLYDNFNTKLPYYWGGRTTGNTIPSNFGTYQPSATSRNGNTYYYTSFDCSGFVSWAIRAGGYNLTNQTSYSFDALYSDDSCVITDSSCIGQPGDLINSPNGHVELIIAVDQDSGKYFIAHSGTAGVVMTQRDMHKGNSSTSTTKVIFMDKYYKNSSNINTNY